MAKNKFAYYKNKIHSGSDYREVIEEVRADYGLSPDFSYSLEYETNNLDVPFNIEREYVNHLIENNSYSEARVMLENMKITYTGAEHGNFIEVYEYHLDAIIRSENMIKTSLQSAKKEFNEHSITIISVVVGVITLLGTANQAFTVENFTQGVQTFFSITLAVILLIVFSFWANKYFKE